MNYCYGCMEKFTGDRFCPHCGYEIGAQPESPIHLKPGTILNGKYMLGKVLGHGGFGITYLAVDINLGVKLAIKEYLPQGTATRAGETTTVSIYSGDSREAFEYGLQKFLEEARTLAMFDDVAEIVIAKDFFKENGTAYLVMSYIDGVNLKEYLNKKGGRLGTEDTLSFILPVMKALEKVHKQGILHRDISPDNIYITKNYNVKLLDFGAARFSMGEHSKSLSILLKPGYAPEEQYRTHGKQGPWTDIYALAATMYKMLTGITPAEALDRFEEDTLKSPSELGIEVPLNIWLSIKKGLSLRGSDRYQTVNEFYNELLKPEGKADIGRKEQYAQMPADKAASIPAKPPHSDIAMAGNQNITSNTTANELITPYGGAEPSGYAQVATRNKKLSNKKIGLIILGGIAFWGVAIALFLIYVFNFSEEPITFKSSTIENVIHKTLNKAADEEIYPNDVEEITTLDLSRQGLTSISDLKWFTHVKTLNLKRNKITSIEPLCKLTEINTLDLSQNNISDLEPIRSLTELATLSLYNNKVKDLEPLCNLIKLKELYLGANKIEDIEPLENLTQLAAVNLSSNEISDIGPLAGLKQLYWLYLYNNKISDLQPLSNLTKLTTLVLGQNKISDLRPLSNLTLLSKLDLEYNNFIIDWLPVSHVKDVTGRP